MKQIFFPLLFLILATHAHAFDSSWIPELVHDKCQLLESKEFLTKSEQWDIEPSDYGVAIGATNALLNSKKSTPKGRLYNVSYYNCPKECFKNGASNENGMIGNENLLTLMGYEPIQCSADLIVTELLQIDFDDDGFMGYAIRYKTDHGGFQGSRGHLFWNVAFIRNSNGKLSILQIEDANIGGDMDEIYYHKLASKQSTLTIQYYTIKSNEGYDLVDRNFNLNGHSLVPSN